MRTQLKDILKFNPKFWKYVGDKIKKWIKNDLKSGKLQGGKESDAYRSEQYKDYKSRYMNRKRDGKKLKAYSGVSIRSNETKKVNMILTGQLVGGLHVKRYDNVSVLMSYEDKDEMKLQGNEDLGRDIRNLNEPNQVKVVKEIEKEISKNIKEYCREPIIIKVGR